METNIIDDVLSQGLAPVPHFRAEVIRRPVAVTQDAPPPVRGVAREFLKRSGLDWTVSKRPLTSEGDDVPTHRLLRRDDNGKQLAVCNEGWEPVQNAEAVALADSLVAQGATLTQGGSFRDGAGVYIFARLDATTTDVVPGDAVRVTVAIRNSHDGKSSLTGSLVLGRLVCRNGLVRETERALLFSLRHTRNVGDRLEWARGIVAKAVAEATKDVETFRALAARRVSTEEIRKYLLAVVPNPVDPEAQIAKRNRERERDEIMQLLETGQGVDLPGVRGSAWWIYNAATEYVDHYDNQRMSDNRRLETNMFGAGAKLKAEALTHAVQLLRH